MLINDISNLFDRLLLLLRQRTFQLGFFFWFVSHELNTPMFCYSLLAENARLSLDNIIIFTVMSSHKMSENVSYFT
jgi:hypothetical protein